MNKKTYITLAIVVGLLTCQAVSDEVKVGALTYRNVAVTGEQDGSIVFVFRGNKIIKPLAQITQIHMSNNAFFNMGETQRLAGQFPEALGSYKRALAQAPETLKSLIEARTKLAASFDSGTAAAPRVVSPLKGKCPHCRDTGLKTCVDCKGCGYAECGECLGKKQITCPTCSGNFGRKCPECNGEKRIQIGSKAEGSGGIFVRPVYEPCKRCDRTGYVCTIKLGPSWISRAGMCPTCGNNETSRLGKMPCVKCKGLGRAGPCPRCKGTRKTICTFCAKVKKTTSGAAAKGAIKGGGSPGAWAFKPGTASHAKKRYDLHVSNAKIEYDRRVKELQAKMAYSLKGIRQTLVLELNGAVKEVAANGDLDEAIKIRDAKLAAEKGQPIPVAPPPSK